MKVWLILEHPRTSKKAMIYGVISLLFVVTSILGFCLETLPQLRAAVRPINGTINGTGCDDGDETHYVMLPNPFLNHLDTICTIFFTIELIIRFGFSPNKLRFVRSPMNIIDLLALVPLYMQLIFNTDDYKFCYVNERFTIEIMFILRIIRMFRIFHLVKHYQALKILVYSLKASVQELLMLLIFLLIGMLVFATMIYYAEREDAVKPSSTFSTIPVGFWWAIITMTTVGYGDVYPKSPLGYVIGGACAISGVLLVALTIPVISNNFTLFYTHVRLRHGRYEGDTKTSIYTSADGFEAKVYENARRTSNGSIILNDSKHFDMRKESNGSAVEGRTNGDLPYNGDLRYGGIVPNRYADVNSMTDVIVKREESDYSFVRTRSVKARSDDGVMYSGETML
ncbi:hypothetical protein ACJMK2_041698 [Sinanodonta woodiana]|uniref:Ion transport domain-containing protein n=1 Tax=Sinanodonta woodiana TaxID=1069815 RepID=A0ABD3W5Y5_SINWO